MDRVTVISESDASDARSQEIWVWSHLRRRTFPSFSWIATGSLQSTWTVTSASRRTSMLKPGVKNVAACISLPPLHLGFNDVLCRICIFRLSDVLSSTMNPLYHIVSICCSESNHHETVLWIPMGLRLKADRTFINNKAVTEEFRLTCSKSPPYSVTDKLTEVEALCLLLLADAALDSAFRFLLDA